MADKRKKGKVYKSSRRQPKHSSFSMGNYYDEENLREERYHDRQVFRGYEDDKKTQTAAKKKNSRKRRKTSRYKLAHPEKLVFGVGALAVCIFLLVMLFRSFSSPESPSAEESLRPIQTIDYSAGAGETGTVRSVGTVNPSNMPDQLAAYMAGLINTNPDNHGEVPEVYEPEPEVNTSIKPENYKFIVAIDAGHGGNDNGWVENGAVEKNIDLVMAEKVAAYINQNSTDYLAYMLRTGDTQMTDQLKVYTAQEVGAHLIVSLHCNGADFEIGGVSGAYWTGEGDTDERASYSLELAKNLMTAAAEGFGTWEQDLRTEDIGIIHTDVPSVLIEMGYLTYSLDNERLQDAERQNEAAAKMGEVILDYIREVEPKMAEKAKNDESKINESGADDSNIDSDIDSDVSHEADSQTGE